ncbi:MAG: hypothetical protein V1718_02625 [archaeon]
MRKNTKILILISLIPIIILSIIINTQLSTRNDSNEDKEYLAFKNSLIRDGIYIRHNETGIIAIDPSELGGTVTSPSKPNEPTEISIDGIAFRYNDGNPFEPFVFDPEDGEPSMVIIFKKGSIKSTLYLDEDAKKALDEGGTIEIIVEGSQTSPLIVNKSDIQKSKEPGLYLIELKDSDHKNDLKETFEELKPKSKTIYPKITTSKSSAKGTTITVKESEEVNPLNSFNEFILWTNMKMNVDFDNDEKKILKEGILLTLEKTVEDRTASPEDKSTEPEDTYPDDVCVIR